MREIQHFAISGMCLSSRHQPPPPAISNPTSRRTPSYRNAYCDFPSAFAIWRVYSRKTFTANKSGFSGKNSAASENWSGKTKKEEKHSEIWFAHRSQPQKESLIRILLILIITKILKFANCQNISILI